MIAPFFLVQISKIMSTVALAPAIITLYSTPILPFVDTTKTGFALSLLVLIVLLAKSTLKIPLFSPGSLLTSPGSATIGKESEDWSLEDLSATGWLKCLHTSSEINNALANLHCNRIWLINMNSLCFHFSLFLSFFS